MCARCFKLRKYARWRDVLSKVVGERFYFCLFVCRYARWRSGGLWRDILRKYARWRGFLSQLVGERFFFFCRYARWRSGGSWRDIRPDMGELH